MNKITNKVLKSWYKFWGYILILPNYVLYKYSNPKTLIILGMHRSGTSCITRILNLCGVYLGPSLLAPQNDNPEGFWENSYVFEINEKILQQSGGSWDNPPQNLKVTFFDKLAMMNVLYNRNNSILGIKDPRLLITWEAWEPLIKNYCIVGIFRHPLSVSKSLNKRNNFDIAKGMDLWKQYNNKLINFTKNEDVILIDFDDFGSFKNKISNVLAKINLKFNEEALNYYNPSNRSCDYIDSIEDDEASNLYNSLKN